jgi:VanZ family protein
MALMLTYNKKNMFRVPVSFGVGALNAVSDEIHQLFVPGRSSEVRDMLIDCVGVLFGILLMLLIRVVYIACKKHRVERKKSNV